MNSKRMISQNLREDHLLTETHAIETPRVNQDAALHTLTLPAISMSMMKRVCPLKPAKFSRTKRSAKSLIMRPWFSTPSRLLVWSWSDFSLTVSQLIARRKEKSSDSNSSLRRLFNSFSNMKMLIQICWKKVCFPTNKLSKLHNRFNDEQCENLQPI